MYTRLKPKKCTSHHRNVRNRHALFISCFSSPSIGNYSPISVTPVVLAKILLSEGFRSPNLNRYSFENRPVTSFSIFFVHKRLFREFLSYYTFGQAVNAGVELLPSAECSPVVIGQLKRTSHMNLRVPTVIRGKNEIRSGSHLRFRPSSMASDIFRDSIHHEELQASYPVRRAWARQEWIRQEIR
jgi:hypothetical protein